MGANKEFLSVVTDHIAEHMSVIKQLNRDELISIITIADTLVNTLKKGGGVFWCGNGGSASDSQHLAAELIGRFKNNRRALKSIALNTDTSVLTCIANDFSYENVWI